MISAVIMAYGGEDYNTVLEQARAFADDIIILSMNGAGYAIAQHCSGRILSSYSPLKGYGEIFAECIEYAAGEYVVFLKSGDSIMTNSSLDIKEGCHTYYADIFEDRYEGTVQYREARVFPKEVSLKGRYQIDEMTDIRGCGLFIQSSSACEKGFLKEWIETELKDVYGWREEYILAECCYVLGQFNNSCSHYKKLYGSMEGQSSASLYRDMCWAFIAGDYFGDARVIIEDAIKEYPDFMEYYYMCAVIYRELGEYIRCISCLKKIFEGTGKEVHKELTEYKGILSYRLMADALFSVEDYINAAFYYKQCALEKTKEKQYMISLCSSLQLSGLCQKEMEEYLRVEIILSLYDVYEAMVEHYRHLRQWDKVGEYARQFQETRTLEVQVESLYHMKSYKRCLSIISSSELMDNDYYSKIGLCCMLLDAAIANEDARNFIIKLKNKGDVEALHAYEYFMGVRASSCREELLQEISEMLLETGDSRCIKYVRKAMDENPSMDYIGLLNRAFACRLYYFCEEIINIYYREGRYEYQVIRILAYVYYYTGKLSECERYISYALIMKKSTDLVKLGCMCKLRECMELIKSNENSMEVRSIQRLLGTISEYENIFILS